MAEPDRLRQILDRFDIREAGMLHQKADRRAVRTATEAMVELLGGTHGKRRGLFVVKRAQPHQVGTALLQLDVLAHHIDNIDAVQQILNE